MKIYTLLTSYLFYILFVILYQNLITIIFVINVAILFYAKSVTLGMIFWR